MLDMAGVVTLP